MKPVFQTVFVGITVEERDGTLSEDSPVGNCYQAVIASMLELELEDVPHFVKEDLLGGLHWLDATDLWLSDRGLFLRWVLPEHIESGEHYIVMGQSPRGDWDHVVIYKDGKLVHDPHPEGTGVLTQDHYGVLRKA